MILKPVMRPAMRSPMGSAMDWGRSNNPNAEVLSILAKYDSHVYLPGIGSVGGLNARNYSDAAFGTPAVVDGVVGSVRDAIGLIDATQATAGSRPALRNTGGKYAWEFDGVNDSLALSSVPLAMSDDFAIITVGQATGVVGWNTLYGQDGATPTRIQVYIDDANGKPGIFYRDDSGTGVDIAGSGDARLAPTVISTANRSNSKVIRVNGVQIGIASITVFGASTFTKAAIGRLGNGTDFHEGPSGPRIIIKGTLTDAEILTLEKWAADITPGGPTI